MKQRCHYCLQDHRKLGQVLTSSPCVCMTNHENSQSKAWTQIPHWFDAEQRIGEHPPTSAFWFQRSWVQAYTGGHSFTEGTLCLQASDPGSVIVGDDVQDVQVSHTNPSATQCRQSWCESKSLRIFNQISNVNSALEDETTLFNCLFTFMVDHLLVPKFCLRAIDFQHDLMVDSGLVKRVEAGSEEVKP